MFFLIAYDISSPRRLKKVAKLMEAYGKRVQRSVFECRLNPNRLPTLVHQLQEIIKARRDRVHIYRMCASCPDLGNTPETLHSSEEAEVFIY